MDYLKNCLFIGKSIMLNLYFLLNTKTGEIKNE